MERRATCSNITIYHHYLVFFLVKQVSTVYVYKGEKKRKRPYRDSRKMKKKKPEEREEKCTHPFTDIDVVIRDGGEVRPTHYAAHSLLIWNIQLPLQKSYMRERHSQSLVLVSILMSLYCSTACDFTQNSQRTAVGTDNVIVRSSRPCGGQSAT